MAVAVLVIGPDDIPKVLYSLGKIVRRLQYIRYALTSQFEDFMQEAELREHRTPTRYERNRDNHPGQTGDDAMPSSDKADEQGEGR